MHRLKLTILASALVFSVGLVAPASAITVKKENEHRMMMKRPMRMHHMRMHHRHHMMMHHGMMMKHPMMKMHHKMHMKPMKAM